MDCRTRCVGHAVEVSVKHRHGATALRHKRADDADGCRFTRAVWAKQRKSPVGNVEVNAVQAAVAPFGQDLVSPRIVSAAVTARPR